MFEDTRIDGPLDITDDRTKNYLTTSCDRSYMDPHDSLSDLPGNKEIARLFSMLACNSHTICDEEERPIGNPLPLREGIFASYLIQRGVGQIKGGMIASFPGWPATATLSLTRTDP